MSIGNKIADLRKEQKLTQKDLAEKLNVSDKVISRWETGNSLPDVEMMKKISKVFKVTIAELYDALDEDDGNADEKDNYERIWQYYDYERIWRYKRSTIISCALFTIAAVVFFLFYWTGDLTMRLIKSQDTRTAIVVLVLCATIVLSSVAVVLQIVSAVSLRSFSETKYYRTLYDEALKKGIKNFVFCAPYVSLCRICR